MKSTTKTAKSTKKASADAEDLRNSIADAEHEVAELRVTLSIDPEMQPEAHRYALTELQEAVDAALADYDAFCRNPSFVPGVCQ